MTFADSLGVIAASGVLLLLLSLLLYALITSIIPWFVALFRTVYQYFPINYAIYLHNRKQMLLPKYSRFDLHNYMAFWEIHADYLQKWQEYSLLQHILAYYHRRKHPEEFI